MLREFVDQEQIGKFLKFNAEGMLSCLLASPDFKHLKIGDCLMWFISTISPGLLVNQHRELP